MQQIVLNIDNPKVEAILSDILKQDKIPIDNIISDIIEKYIYLYSIQLSANKKEASDFIELMNTDTISLKNDNLTRDWIYKNNISDDLYR